MADGLYRPGLKGNLEQRIAAGKKIKEFDTPDPSSFDVVSRRAAMQEQTGLLERALDVAPETTRPNYRARNNTPTGGLITSLRQPGATTPQDYVDIAGRQAPGVYQAMAELTPAGRELKNNLVTPVETRVGGRRVTAEVQNTDFAKRQLDLKDRALEQRLARQQQKEAAQVPNGDVLLLQEQITQAESEAGKLWRRMVDLPEGSPERTAAEQEFERKNAELEALRGAYSQPAKTSAVRQDVQTQRYYNDIQRMALDLDDETKEQLKKYGDWKKTADLEANGYMIMPEDIAQAREARNNISKLEETLQKNGLTKEQAEKLLDFQQRQYAAESAQRTNALAAEMAGENGWSAAAATFLRTPLNLVGGLAGSIDLTLQNLRNNVTGDYRPLDFNTPANMPSNIANALTGGVTESIRDSWAGDVGAFLYGTATSMVDSAAAAAVTAATGLPGAVLLAGSAARSSMQEAKARGATDGQAVAFGLLAGVAEEIFEEISLEKLLDLRKEKGFWKNLKNILLQGGTEASEEVFTSLANGISDVLLLKDKSEIMQAYQGNLNSGMSPKDAAAKTFTEQMNGLGLDALGGALSGGFMGGGKVLADSILQSYIDTATGKTPVEAQKNSAPVEVVDSEGNIIKIGNGERANPTSLAADGDAGTQSPLSNDSIPQQLAGVNPEDSANPSIGAADAGFDPFSQWQNQADDFHPEGERADRVVDLPTVNQQGENTMRTGRTLMESANTPDARVRQIEKMYVDGAMAYVPEVNAERAQKASETIERYGWDSALNNWTSEVRKGKVNADLVAMGATLLNNMGNSNASAAAYADLVADYSMLLHNAGQGLQAARIFKMLTPEGRLYAIQRSIDAINEQIKGETGVEMDTKLMDDYRNATTDEVRAAALEALMQDVADKVPSTLADKWTALRYVNMLGNFKTQLRNLAGNTAMTAMRSIKDEVAAGIEAAAQALGADFERSKSARVGPEWMKATTADFDVVEDAAMGNSRYREGSTGQIMQEIDDRRTIFKVNGDWGKTADSNAVSKVLRAVADVGMGALEGYRKLTNWATDAGDVVFIKHHYARALAGYLKANGISVAQFMEGNVDAGLLDRARSYAIREAQEATFHDNNAFSDWVSKIGRRSDTPKAAKMIAEGVAPFRKTPANVLVRAYEYSPLGFIDTVAEGVKASKGNATASDVINSAARSLTGTGLLLLGLALRSRGLIRAKSEEGEEEIDALMNRQDYSMILGEHSYTMDWLSPTMLPVFMGAVLQDTLNDKELTWADVDNVIGRFMDPVLNMSMVSGIDDALRTIKYSDNGLLQLAASFGLSYLTQGATNSLVGQIERTTEENRMTTYTDPESDLPQWLQKALGKASAKTPIWDFQQTEYLDEFGQKESSGEWYERLFENLISPGYHQKSLESDPVRAEIEAVHKETGRTEAPEGYAPKSFTVEGTKYELTPQQRQDYQRIRGQLSYDYLRELHDSSLYRSSVAEVRADLQDKVEDIANEIAKKQYLASQGVEYKSNTWGKALEAMESIGLTPVQWLGYDMTLDALNDNNSVDMYEAALALERMGAGLPAEQKAEVWDLQGKGQNWSPEKNPYTGALPEAGIETGTVLDIMDEYIRLSREDGAKAKDQQTDFSKYLDQLGLSGDQRETVDDLYHFRSSMPVSPYAYSYDTMGAEQRKAWDNGGKAAFRGSEKNFTDKYYEIKPLLEDIESLTDKDGKTISNSSGLLKMQAIYQVPGLTDDQRRAMFEAFGVGKTVIGYSREKVERELEKMRKK